jgi:hypothetical protein
MKVSKYNINHGKLDQNHVELLKAQIAKGNDIPIRWYSQDTDQYIIDGGHAYEAYRQLDKEPPVLMEVPFTNGEDMIAFSRHCNVNRINQSPVSYAESIVKEVKMRLGVGDDKVKWVFNKYRHIKDRGDKDGGNISPIMESIFSSEPIKIDTFREIYLPLLDLPEPIREDIEQHKLDKSHAAEIAKIKDKEKQQKAAEIVRDDSLSWEEAKNLVKDVKKGESPEYAATKIHAKKAEKRVKEAPEAQVTPEEEETWKRAKEIEAANCTLMDDIKEARSAGIAFYRKCKKLPKTIPAGEASALLPVCRGLYKEWVVRFGQGEIYELEEIDLDSMEKHIKERGEEEITLGEEK